MEYKNNYLDTNPRAEDNNYSVYYKIILNSDNLVTIACLQDFDEYDYNQDRFFKDEDGACVAFYSEENAKKYLNEKFKQEVIAPEYLVNYNHNNLFRGMLKDE